MANRKNPKPSNTAIPCQKLKKTLAERGARYGKFSDHARAFNTSNMLWKNSRSTMFRNSKLPIVSHGRNFRLSCSGVDYNRRQDCPGFSMAIRMYDDNWHDIQDTPSW